MDAGPRIAIDAMGGDTGPAAIVAGIGRAHRRDRSLQFLVYGDEKIIQEELSKHGGLASEVTVCHTPEFIDPSDKPSQAIRRAKTTSMGVAINAVKDGQAHAAVSGGNTGALMAMSKLALRTMPGIDRPALAALLPTLGEQDCVMLDLGANTECDAQNLVQFAVMGSAYARTVLGVSKPRVKLLNIETEELKRTDELKEDAGRIGHLRARQRDGDRIGLPKGLSPETLVERQPRHLLLAAEVEHGLGLFEPHELQPLDGPIHALVGHRQRDFESVAIAPRCQQVAQRLDQREQLGREHMALAHVHHPVRARLVEPDQRPPAIVYRA